ncbi:MAG: xanthine dehydrogenase family protein subunit M [SAR324 cluster bacterium]|nr:xanthine dehydrogenase family protein subunit M [SAR324 cluster bacterium]
MSEFAYYKPQSLEEVWKLKGSNLEARYIAGGTDLLIRMKNRIVSPSTLISLRSVSELSGITVAKDVNIGSGVTIRQLTDHSELNTLYPVLMQAAKCLGSAQIRNVATLGGNLCNASPAADMAPPLLVLDAVVQILGLNGSREMALQTFFVGPGQTKLGKDEILTAIKIPIPSPAAKAVFIKKGRVGMDLSKACLAVLIEMEGKQCKRARIAAGAVGPVPMRLKKTESRLEGETLTQDIIKEAQAIASAEVTPITDLRSTEAYRRELVGVLLKKAIEQLYQ